MIQFNNLSQETPYQFFYKKYNEAISMGEKNIQAMAISSYSVGRKEISSRFVNLKIIDKSNFIFFTNYESPKAIDFSSHKQISALFFWSSINVQIRIKAKIRQTSRQFNKNYFKNRSKNKNALAISSKQSQPISNFDEVVAKYDLAKQKENLRLCPDYWGGYSFKPFEIEFWEGNEFRLNKRIIYKKNKTSWSNLILEP